jgi:hypothetical protein
VKSAKRITHRINRGDINTRHKQPSAGLSIFEPPVFLLAFGDNTDHNITGRTGIDTLDMTPIGIIKN